MSSRYPHVLASVASAVSVVSIAVITTPVDHLCTQEAMVRIRPGSVGSLKLLPGSRIESK